MWVRRAQRVERCPVVAAAWAEGRLSSGQVDAVVARVSDRTQGLFADHEGEVVAVVAPLGVRDTERALRHWAAYAEALVEAPVPEPSSPTVVLAAVGDGWQEVSGRLDPVGAQVVGAALDAATVADGVGEPVRSRGQRRADALVAVARHFLDHAAAVTTTRRRRPDVTVVVSVAELGRRAGRSVDGDVLDAAGVASLLCDAGVHRVVTGGAGAIVDVGRTTRTVGHHQFRALAVRDGGCRFPGCDRPVSCCEAHHVVPWEHGGATDVSNLVLLCWRHHHDFAHHRRWQLKLLPDATVEVTKPDGHTLTSRAPPVGV